MGGGPRLWGSPSAASIDELKTPDRSDRPVFGNELASNISSTRKMVHRRVHPGGMAADVNGPDLAATLVEPAGQLCWLCCSGGVVMGGEIGPAQTGECR